LPLDERPSQEDIERFSKDEMGYCPNCGDEIWDDANHCNSCGEWVSGNTLHQDPVTRSVNKKLILMITVLVLIAFFWGFSTYF
jgi:uncharacterized membrane protein YvbJ